MTGLAVVSIILLAAISIVALFGIWHERRARVDAELASRQWERMAKRRRALLDDYSTSFNSTLQWLREQVKLQWSEILGEEVVWLDDYGRPWVKGKEETIEIKPGMVVDPEKLAEMARKAGMRGRTGGL